MAKVLVAHLRVEIDHAGRRIFCFSEKLVASPVVGSSQSYFEQDKEEYWYEDQYKIEDWRSFLFAHMQDIEPLIYKGFVVWKLWEEVSAYTAHPLINFF
jgi:hypothetical protein